MGGIGKTIAGIASAVAPALSLIPGVGTVAKVAGAVLPALMAGGQASGAQNGLMGGASGAVNAQNAVSQQYYGPLFQALLSQSGIDPATGKMTPGFSLFGPTAGAVGGADRVAEEAQRQTNGIQAAMAGRGFNGGSSVTPAMVAQTERGAYGQQAGLNRQAQIDGSSQLYQRMVQMMSLLQPNTAGAMQVAGGYAGNAANAANGLSQGLSALVQSGIFGKKKTVNSTSDPNGPVLDPNNLQVGATSGAQAPAFPSSL